MRSSIRYGLFVLLLAVLAGLLVSRSDETRVPGPRETPGVSWSEPLEVASGPAEIGPWEMNESEWDYVDDPTVVFDPEGGVALAWVDEGRKDVLLQRFDAAGEPRFEAPVDVSRTPEVFSWLPRIAFAPDGPETLYALWQEIVFSGGSHGGEAFFARSTDGGRSFEAPVNLSESPEGDGKGRLTHRLWDNGSLDLTVGPDGSVHVAWTEYEGRLWYRRSVDGGESFGPRVLVAGGEGESPARAPSVAVDADGSALLAWTVGEDTSADLRMASSSPDGSEFGEPWPVMASDGHSDAPKIAVDGDGRLHLAWGEAPGGLFTPYRIRYVRSHDGGRSFEVRKRLGTPLSAELASMSFPHLSLGSGGTVYVAWELFPERGRRPMAMGFARSRDGGDSFTEPAVVPGTAEKGLGPSGSLQGLLMRKLAAGPDGRLALVNSRIRKGEESRIRLFFARDSLR